MIRHVEGLRNWFDKHPERMTVWIMGDWNLPASGETPFSTAQPDVKLPSSHVSALQKKWQTTLGKFTELHQPMPSRYEVGSLSAARLGRVYTSMPRWELVLTESSSYTFGHPKDVFEQGISDHTGVGCTFGQREQLSHDRPIHKSVFKLPRFKELHDKYCEDVKLDEMPVMVRWQQHKTIIREAARLARNAAMSEPNRPLFLDTQISTTSESPSCLSPCTRALVSTSLSVMARFY